MSEKKLTECMIPDRISIELSECKPVGILIEYYDNSGAAAYEVGPEEELEHFIVKK